MPHAAARLLRRRCTPGVVPFYFFSFSLLLMLFLMGGCSEEAHQPPYREIVELHGTPYERGFQHGQRFASKIRSLYTQLLTSSLLPWLNREQTDIASVLTEYQDPRYSGGRFSYQVLLESGLNLMKYIPEPYLEEMRGVADGADLPFDEVLVLNTFVDTMLGMRAITLIIRALQSPHIQSIEFVGGLDTDGVDNDGDGVVDEQGEGIQQPYRAFPHASMVEVPVDAKIRMVLQDPEGVDPASIRIQLDTEVYVGGHESIETLTMGSRGDRLEVTFTPPHGLPLAGTVSVLVSAGDLTWITDPPPAHARMMRDERFVFTTKGVGKAPYEVENRGAADNRYQPPSIGFAVRNTATADGRMLVAHHFALLDSNTSHKHTVLFVHHPSEGQPHVVLGWTGIVWGFSGMNQDGLVYTANVSDTLDNPVVGEFLRDLTHARLLCSGVPMGIVGREILTGSSEVDQAMAYLKAVDKTFGWNLILADPSGKMVGAEVDSNILGEADRGFYSYTPDTSDPQNVDPWGRPWASVGPDDLRMASHFQRNTEDIDFRLFKYPLIPPQRDWTSFYFRSLRAFYILGERISSSYGRLDVPSVINILRLDDLIDHRDSMNASVYDPGNLMLYFAMGQVPATSGPFITFDVAEALGQGGAW